MVHSLIARTALQLYRALGVLATPAIHAHLRRRCRRGREDPARLGERFGHAGVARPPGSLVWLHASSVGESLSCLVLIREIGKRWPTAKLLMTTGTVTSARLMGERLPSGVIHQFAPIDHPSAVRRFFAHWRPDLGLIVESELWPNLLTGARRFGVELILVNGRISPASFRSWRRYRPIIRYLLETFDLVIAQTPEDQARFDELGAPATACHGNLKFAAEPLAADSAELAAVETALNERPRWLAASTHPGEEEMVATAHRIAAERHAGLVTLIAPRHPDRGSEIADRLRGAGFTVARRGAGEAMSSATEIYIADTLGELGIWYRAAEVVFVGGSLIPKGGQNPLEPAKLNCAVLCGPHIANFQRMTDEMAAAGAIRRIADAADLGAAVAELLSDAESSHRLAAAGRSYANEQTQVLASVLRSLEPHFSDLESRHGGVEV